MNLLWDAILEYFHIVQETAHITCYKLKNRYRIGEDFRYHLIVQGNSVVVYSSFSKRDHSLVVTKNLFSHKTDAELFIREEIMEIINKNIQSFIFGSWEE